MPTTVKNQLAGCGLVIWTLVLVVASLQPHRPGWAHSAVPHQSYHIACFGVLGLLAAAAFPRSVFLRWLVPACLGFGVALEMLQHVLYRNPIEWNDIRDDGIGTLIAILIFRLASVFRRPGAAGVPRLR